MAVSIFALPFMASAGSQTFYSNDTFTVPAGVTQITVTGSASGGAGGPANTATASGSTGGGSGGNISGKTYGVTSGAFIPVTIGGAGQNTTLGSLVTLTAGGNGGTDRFLYPVADCIIYGGTGGSPNGVNGTPSILEGYGTGWDGGGVYSCYLGSNLSNGGGNSVGGAGGIGGSCIGAAPGNGSGSIPGAPGILGGGGGGGAYCEGFYGESWTSGGPGGPGFITITWVEPTFGTINVSSNIPGANWTITGPVTLNGAGTSASYLSRPTGTYNITWGVVSGYTAPVSGALALTSGGIIAFSGNYTANNYGISWTAVNGSATPSSCTFGTIVTPICTPNSGYSTANCPIAFTCATSNLKTAIFTAILPPTAINPTHIGITTTSATLGADVTADGGSPLTERGTCLGTTPTPFSGGICTFESLNPSLGVFTQLRSGLLSGTTYYYQGFGRNIINYGLTTVRSFNTLCSNGATNTPTCTPAPTVSSFTNNGPIITGNSATLTWTTSGATSCSINNGIGAVANNSNIGTGVLTTTTTYTITCTSAGGLQNTGQTTVTVGAALLPLVAVTVSPSTVTTPDPFSVVMSSINTASCTWSRTGTYAGNWSNQPVPAPNKSYNSGPLAWPAGSATWTFTCQNASGSTDIKAGSVTVNSLAPVDGGWTAFGPYGACTVPCGGGTQTATRTCTNPTPANGGAQCVGSATQVQACNTQACALPPCLNGATNPPTCNTCSAGQTFAFGVCYANCTNGATNPPTCNSCPLGQTLVAGTCVASCINGATNPPACNSCPLGKTLVAGICTATGPVCGDTICTLPETLLSCPVDCKGKVEQF